MVKLNSAHFISAKTMQGGEIITIKNEGGWVVNQKFTYPDGTPRNDFQMAVDVAGEERILNVNKTNRDALSKAWGEETKDWIGKQATIRLIDCMVSGKMIKTIILEPMGSTKGAKNGAQEIPWES